ncbi:MAG: ABC transporter permease [Paramuribaculum sp.]|nr:ABC transporter permease [Paramuribaculum sp.]
MRTEFFISRRLALRAEGSRRMATGVTVAVTGMTLAIIIMIVSISVVIGFKNEIRSKVSGFNSQIMLYPAEAYAIDQENPGIRLSDTLLYTIQESIPDAQVTLSMRRPAIFKTDNAFQGIILKGMSTTAGYEFIAGNLVQGNLPPTHPDSLNFVTISASTARALNVGVGQKLLTHFIHNNNLRTRSLEISGIYNSHFSDFDDMYAFVPLGMLQRLARVDSITGSMVEISGIDDTDVDQATSNLHNVLLRQLTENPEKTPLYAIDNVHHSGAVYFTWLSLLDTNVVVILILMSVVSGFTLVSCMFILILERVRMIGLLKAMGATNGFIRRIFIYMAQRIVMRGLIAGNVIGLTLIALQKHLHLIPLDADSYYLDYVPVEISWWWILLLNAGAVFLSWLILIVPSHSIARLSPAESMRYE